MALNAAQIGFDRFIRLDWATAALNVRAGLMSVDQLSELLASSHAGPAAQKKTQTVLNRLWLQPRADLVNFADRGVRIYRDNPAAFAAALTWGMALATYSFFGRVAEITGRLTALQGACTSVEIHRRMMEAYGDREGTRRMTNMVLQSQADWGAIERLDKGKRILRKQSLNLEGSAVAEWLAEACLRYAGRALSISALETHPAIYPFTLGNSTSYMLSRSSALEMRQDSAGQQMVSVMN